MIHISQKIIITIYSILIVGTFFLWYIQYKKSKSLKDGELIEVFVLKIPDCKYYRDVNIFLEFSYENRSYNKRIKNKDCKVLYDKYFSRDIRVIQMLTNKDRTEFAFPFDEFKSDFFSFIIIEVIFIFCLLKVLFKSKFKNHKSTI